MKQIIIALCALSTVAAYASKGIPVRYATAEERSFFGKAANQPGAGFIVTGSARTYFTDVMSQLHWYPEAAEVVVFEEAGAKSAPYSPKGKSKGSKKSPPGGANLD